MSKYLWLVRHAESQGNLEGRIQGWADYPLTELGQWQAAQLAERLVQERSIGALISSPQQRAAETAQVIGDVLGLPVRFDARLKEYNFGPLNGLMPDEIIARFPVVRAAWEINRPWQPLPGEEGEPAFLARVQEAMDEIVAGMAEDTTLAVVAHGGSLDACLRAWLGINGREERRAFTFDNASLSLVRVRGRSYRVLLLNDTCHLKNTRGDIREGGGDDSG